VLTLGSRLCSVAAHEAGNEALPARKPAAAAALNAAAAAAAVDGTIRWSSPGRLPHPLQDRCTEVQQQLQAGYRPAELRRLTVAAWQQW
jgi:hypothetical protein